MEPKLGEELRWGGLQICYLCGAWRAESSSSIRERRWLSSLCLETPSLFAHCFCEVAATMPGQGSTWSVEGQGPFHFCKQHISGVLSSETIHFASVHSQPSYTKRKYFSLWVLTLLYLSCKSKLNQHWRDYLRAVVSQNWSNRRARKW